MRTPHVLISFPTSWISHFCTAHCRGPEYLKHSECYYRSRDQRRGSHGCGAVLLQPASCSALRLVLKPILPLSAHFLEKSWMCLHEQNSMKNLVCPRNVHQVNDKRKQIESPLSFHWLSSFSLFIFVYQPQLQRVHVAGSMQDLRTSGILFFSPFSLPGQNTAIIFYPTILLCEGMLRLMSQHLICCRS